MDIITQAIDKIEQEINQKTKLSQKGQAVSSGVVSAVKMFCKQNAEFAQAVVQSNKTVNQCIEHTVYGCGSSISDIEVYRKAAEFYFSGATVRFEMILDIGDGGFSNFKENLPGRKPLRLSLDDLL